MLMKKRQIAVVTILLVGAVFAGNSLLKNWGTSPEKKAQQLKKDQIEEQKKKNREENHAQFLKLLAKRREDYISLVKEAEQKKRQEAISLNTLFVRKNGTVLYDGPEGEKTDKKLDARQKVFITEKIEKTVQEEKKTWYSLQKSYEDSTHLGWLEEKFLTGNREDFIQKLYEGVDYTPQKKVVEYAGNPRVEAKGVYVTGHSAAGKRLESLLELSKRSAINTFVIDVKDDNETMLFYSKTAEKYSPDANKRHYIKDMDAFMKKLKENNIYVIGRVVTFKSPRYAKSNPDRAILRRATKTVYQSRDNIHWASPYDRDLWAYNVGVAKEAAAYGFNEIQFDYVRFPASGGGKLDASLDYRNKNDETKSQAIQEFLKYAYKELSAQEVYVAADVFGWVASAINDVGIGQHWEGLTNVTDYMCPMMYPSHYGTGNYGLSVPDAYPYETIDRGIKDALKRDANVETPARLRPWIQDFTAPWVKGHITYGPAQIAAQIKALEDNGINEYLLWNAANVYTEKGIR